MTAAGLAIFALAHDHLPLLALFALFVVIGLGFGCTAAPTFASVFRTLPAAEQPQGTTALFMTVQFAASLGVTLLGLLQSRVPAHWLTLLFGITTVAALAIAVLARALPGRPAGQYGRPMSLSRGWRRGAGSSARSSPQRIPRGGRATT